jgi:hypothetical protein
LFLPSFPRRPESRAFRAKDCRCQCMDVLRFLCVKADTPRLQAFSHESPWIPAFAGMTVGGLLVIGVISLIRD